MNNVDLRYNFMLNGELTTLVTASLQSGNVLLVYRINTATRQLENVSARTIKAGFTVYGACMYHSPFTGKYYTFLTKSPYPTTDPSANTGAVQQWELFESGGKVDARMVRTFTVGSDSEGCAADDETGDLFIAETKKALWKYSAEPDGGSNRVQIAAVGGELEGELEGVTIYYGTGGRGYLLVSEQCCSHYSVFQREAPHAFVTRYRVVDNTALGIDGVSGTDGMDVTNFPLNSTFPRGMIVMHDTSNPPTRSGYTNFKLVRWDDLANGAAQPLLIDTSYDPRQVGLQPGIGTPTPRPATATPTPTRTPTATAMATATTPPATPTVVAGPGQAERVIWLPYVLR